MKNYDLPDLFVAFCAGILAAMALAAIGEIFVPDIKKQAIERGYAEYIVDSDGISTWRWKDANP